SEAAHGLKKSWESPELWPRIRESLARESFAPTATGVATPAPRTAPTWPAWLPIAAIATLFLVSFVGLQVFRPSLGDRQIFGVRPLPRDPLLTDVALDDVERSESEYVRSIENLSKLARPRLDAAEATPLLLSYREKLLLLDNAIAELDGEIRQNRYNTHLRRQLLGMYAEKQRTLRDVMKGASS
ncbi:MAG: anti-sigma factor, partial [Acidobacteriota bacterium]|nr:anti-sigma factor [Acidobacteriota bacterium]